jgi:hypothetical protein
MRPLALAVAILGLLGGGPASAASPDLKELLDGLAPTAPAPEGKVAVTGWLETSPAGTELVVTLTPSGAARLVADPGITVTPLAGANAVPPGEPVELVDASLGYITEPRVLRVPLPRHDGGMVEAEVDYAYCLVDTQCLFGEAVVRVEGVAPGG